MSGNPTGYSRPVSRFSVIEATGSTGTSGVRAGRLGARRSLRDERMYVSIVITFVVATTAISIYDMYLLLTLMAG